MKYIIDKVSKSSGRLGHLVQPESDTKLMTPLLLQTTKGGSVPYLAREVFDYLTKDVQVLEMSLATMDEMAKSVTKFTGGIAAYCGYKDYPTVMIVRDPCEICPSGHHERDLQPLYTRRGKMLVNPKQYMEMIECFRPDIYQGLSDADTDINSSKKRVQKSAERTNHFMDYIYKRHQESEQLKKSALFAPIVGGYNTFARTASINHYLKKGANLCAGFMLEGFDHGGYTATQVDRDDLVNIVRFSLNQLPAEKPRMMAGAYTPAIVLELVKLGVDIFDSSYAYLAAINHKALTYNFDLTQECDETATTPFLDMTQESLQHDFKPFLRGCTCLACQKHTRAYVHHLTNVKELVGPILLMIHNLHHSMQFFRSIHAAIAADTLPELIQLIQYQGTEDEIDYSIAPCENASPNGAKSASFFNCPTTAAPKEDEPTVQKQSD